MADYNLHGWRVSCSSLVVCISHYRDVESRYFSDEVAMQLFVLVVANYRHHRIHRLHSARMGISILVREDGISFILAC
jgi:hypothetical protein